ncbi:DUF2637 domain-containing protein [Streptomyces sp. NBC_00237]|uniref:DUF2637 domain-containing protein n=1 Tax=Streptomyces sp. NBC_00237 TaxID=2975687 RepID=UPI002258924D|nr:DUF2637 domain-containing protein [Streptomyces sp. NBC_00237]MCX5207703.1 DUF2637 domain-containing protein [Streptomyces sp. NBC_00237]
MSTTIEPQTLPGPAPAPDTAPSVSSARPTAPVARPTAPPDRTTATPARNGAPVSPVPAPPAEETAPVSLRKAPPKEKDRAGGAMRAVTIAVILCAAIIAGIGFAASYSALHQLAVEKHFGPVAPYAPIGIDAGIIAMYGIDLVMAWRRSPKPLFRHIGHLLTLCTIAFNAKSGDQSITGDPVGAVYHAAMPLLFIAVVEAARHLVIRTAQVRLGAAGGVPLRRWLLSPFKSWSLFRRMKLWEIGSYKEALALEQQRTVYAAWLAHKHGRGWKRKAGAEAMLPFKMAPYGLGVEEALALPEAQREAERAREAAKREAAAAVAAAEEQRRLAEERRVAEAAVARMRISATVTTAEHTIAAETTTAAAEARAAEAEATVRAAARERVAAAEAETEATSAVLTAEATRRQAERAAREIAEAEQSAEAAEARAIEAAALAAEARDRAEAAELTAKAVRLEKAAAEGRNNEAAYERERARLLAEQAEFEAARAAARRQEAEDRAEAARAELAAQEAEDLARLSPRERAERRVARLILAAGGTTADTVDALRERVSLEEVGELLGVGRTVAGERRQAAADLIKSGYTG